MNKKKTRELFASFIPLFKEARENAEKCKADDTKTQRIKRINIACSFSAAIFELTEHGITEISFEKGTSVEGLIKSLCDESYDSVSLESFIEFYPALKGELGIVMRNDKLFSSQPIFSAEKRRELQTDIALMIAEKF